MTAFYTPAPVVREIAASLREAGIVPKRILDPSAGNGRVHPLFDTIAAEGHTTFRFWKKDILTGQMLCPASQRQDTHPGLRGNRNQNSMVFDVVSSNIPFGDVAVFDPFSARRQNLPERSPACPCTLLFRQGVDMLREGGVLAFITSQGVMNAPTNEPAREVADEPYPPCLGSPSAQQSLLGECRGRRWVVTLLSCKKQSGKTSLTEERAKRFIKSERNAPAGVLFNTYLRSMSQIVHTSGSRIPTLTASLPSNSIITVERKASPIWAKSLRADLAKRLIWHCTKSISPFRSSPKFRFLPK